MCSSCAEKDEEIRQLRTELYGHQWEPPVEFGLTPQQVAFLQALFCHPMRVATKEFLVEASRFRNAKEPFPDARLVSTVIFNMRQKLARFGIEIETVKGRGYCLSQATRLRLQNWPSHPPQSTEGQSSEAA